MVYKKQDKKKCIEFDINHIPIYVFYFDDDYFIGFSKSITEWVIFVDGIWIYVDKRYITPLDVCTFDDILEKYQFLVNDVRIALTRVLPLPPEFYNMPITSLTKTLEWIHRISKYKYGDVDKIKRCEDE